MKITILEDLCKGCGYCIEVCPVEIFQESTKINKKGYTLPKVENSDSCTNCKRCELICPELAIDLEKEENNDESTDS